MQARHAADDSRPLIPILLELFGEIFERDTAR